MLVIAVGAIGETAADVVRLLGCVTDGAAVIFSGVLKTAIYIHLLGTGLE